MKYASAKAFLLLGVAFSGLAAGEPARAEAAAEDDRTIIVTAQRREERLLDVPIAITAHNAESLDKAGVSNLQDLERVTPGLQLPLYGGFLRPSIRGISSGLSTLNDSSNVAIYVDGVYQPIQNGAIIDLPDVETVQILKGPQGTLYGQNATGGAIIIDTVRPKFDTTGRVSVSYGKYDEIEARGFVTGPISERVAVLLSGSVTDRDGYNRNLITGERDKGLRSYVARGKFLFDFGDTSFTLAGFYANRKDTNPFSNTPLNGNSIGNALIRLYQSFGILPASVPLASKPHEFAITNDGDLQTKMWGLSLLGDIGVGEIGTLNTVTAYQKFRTISTPDVEASALPFADVDPLVTQGNYFIQELNFTSEHFGGFYFTAGGFYMHRIEEFWPSNFTGYFSLPAQLTGVPDFIQWDWAHSSKNSYAAYLELNYDITDQLTVTVAGRYSYEKVRVSSVGFLQFAPGPFTMPPLVDDPRGSHTFDQFTPRAVLRYKINNDHTVYASYSKGFKSGFVDFQGFGECPGGPQDVSCLPDTVRPETVDSFEVGYKGRFGRIFSVSLAAFHYKYKDIQVFIYNPPSGFYQNAAAGRVYGFDFDFSVEPTPNLRLAVGGSYVDTKYTEFPGAQVFEQWTPAQCAAQFLPFPCGNNTFNADVSGNQFQNAPKFTGTASIDYHHDFDPGRFGINVSGTYNSGFPFDVAGHINQKEYALLNGELSFEPAGVPGLRLVIWSRNLTDVDYIAGSLPVQFGDIVSWAPPRTYGVRGEFRF
jgi:iron complex outermembrane recepter protein